MSESEDEEMSGEVASPRRSRISSPVVEIDMETALAEFAEIVDNAEKTVSGSADVRKMAMVLLTSADEIQKLDGDGIGINVRQYSAVLLSMGQELKKASDWDSGDNQLKADMLRLLLVVAKRVPPKMKMDAQTMLKRWDDLGKLKQQIIMDNGISDMPFGVKVTKEGSTKHIATGTRGGMTYWHNLRWRANEKFGKFDEETSEVWREAKEKLKGGEEVVEIGVWRFERL